MFQRKWMGVVLALVAGSAASAWGAGTMQPGHAIALSASQRATLESALALDDADRAAIAGANAIGLDFAALDRPGMTERSGFVAVQLKSPKAVGLMIARERAESLAKGDAHRRTVQPASAIADLAQARLEHARARLAPSLVKSFEDIDEHRVRVPEGMTEEQLAEALMATGDYEYVQPDWTCFPMITSPNDPQFSNEYHHGVNQLNTVTAWDYVTGGPTTLIGTGDTGIDLDHPDLQASIVDGYNAVDRETIAEGGDISDINGHGSGSMGCVAAIGNNSTGVAGMGWNFGILHARVTNDSGGNAAITDLKRAARWCSDRGASTVSLSYSGVDSGQVGNTGSYVEDEGHQLFWSSGNEGTSMVEAVPDEIVVVGAVSTNGLRASFSNYGPQLDVMAHGVNVRSCNRTGGYTWFGGTSAAAPLANGAGALLYSANPDLSPPQVRQILYETATDIGDPGYDNFNGWGRINIGAGVIAAISGDFTTPFPLNDDFDAPTLNMARWTNASGVAITSAGDNEPSGANSLGLDSTDSVETVRLSGSNAPSNLGVSFLAEHVGVEAGERLVVEYRDGGSWTALTSFVSDGNDLDEYRWVGAHIPGAEALTDELKVRVRAEGNQGDDDWYVDNVAVGALPAIGVPWMETFEAPVDTSFVWPVFGATTSGTADTGSAAASLGSGATMQTGPIDASAFTGGGDAYVSFRVRGSGVASGQTLTAEVKDAAGVWQTMAILTDGSVSGSSYKTIEADFDAAWVSADFEVRLTSSAGSGAWLIDNVYVGPTSFADGGCNAADVNADGVLNLDDVNLFASAFASGSLVADVDGNGVLNLDDVNVFAGAFIAGCP